MEEGGLPPGGTLTPKEVARGSSQLGEEDLALINKLLQIRCTAVRENNFYFRGNGTDERPATAFESQYPLQ